VSDGKAASSALWVLVTLLAIAGAFVLGMYALTSPDARPALLGQLSPLLIGLVAGLPGVLAALRGEQIKRDHGAKLDTIQHQTNGELRKSVSEIVGNALDARGLVEKSPRQRRAQPSTSSREVAP
jgi:hypothetical protein